MAPRAGTVRSNKIADRKEHGRVVLRAIATVSAVCGVVVNAIAVVAISKIESRHHYWKPSKDLVIWAFLPLVTSLLWNLIHLGSKIFTKRHPYLQAGGDTLAFLGFLVILVGNGILATRMGSGAINQILVLAYNSVPWIVCADMHLCLIFYHSLSNLDLTKLPQIKIEWPEQPNARTPLPASEYHDYDDDVESQPRGINAGHRRDLEEQSPLLGST